MTDVDSRDHVVDHDLIPADHGHHHPVSGVRRWLSLPFVAGLVVGVLAIEAGIRVLEMRTGDLAGATGTVGDHTAALTDERNDFDVVAIGSSSAGAGLMMADLERAGIACDGYVAWLPGTSMRELSAFASEVVLPQAPDRLLVALTMREFAPSARLATELDGRRWDPRRPPGAELALIRARTTVQDPERLGRAVTQTPEDELTPDGNQVFMLDRFIADETAAHREQEALAMADYRHDPAAFDDLITLLADARADSVTPIVVNVPVTEEFIALAPGGRADYESYVGSLAAVSEDAGVEFVDLGATELELAQDFADVNHLNRHGAAKATALLAEHLAHCEA